MPIPWLGPTFDPLRRLFSAARPIEPEPDPFAALGDILGAQRHPFYNLPQAQAMERSGGIHPEDVAPLDPKGGAFTRGVTKGTLGIGGGLSEILSHLPGLVIPGAPPTKGLQQFSDTTAAMSDALSTEYERETPIEQQLLQRPVKTTAHAFGQSLPYMATAAAGPVAGPVVAGLATGGEQSREFREQGVTGARNLIPSLASGMAIGFMERLGISPTLKGVAAPKLVRIFTQALSEGGTEALQEIPSVLAEIGAGTRKGESAIGIAKDTLVRMGRSGLIGGAVGGVVGPATPHTADVAARDRLVRQLEDAAGPPKSIVTQAVESLAEPAEPFRLAAATVDGRVVRPDVPNLSSIGASLSGAYRVLPGVREVRLDQFTLDEVPGSAITDRRTLDLADQIRQSNEINPLIVAVDQEGPYILEGGHRYDALKAMGAKSFPAVVVMEEGVAPVPVAPTGPALVKSKPTEEGAVRAGLLAQSIKDWARKYLLTPEQRRKMAPGLHKEMVKLENNSAAHLEEIQRNADEFTRMVRGIDKKALPEPLQQPQQLAGFLDKAYRGLLPQSVVEKYTPSLVNTIAAMREHTGRLERDMRKLGLLTDATARNLERSFGLHVHRDFQSRFDTDYRVLVQHQPIYRRAFELWRDQELKEAYDAAYDAHAKLDDPTLGIGDPATIREDVLKTWREERRIRPDGDEEIIGVVTVPTVRKIPGEMEVGLEEDAEGIVLTGRPVYEIGPPKDIRVLSSPQLEGKLLEYVTWANRGSGVPLPGGHIEGALDRSTVMHREERLPDFERLLLGEVKDTAANYVESARQMAAMIENQKFLNRLKEIGLNEFLFHKPRPGFTQMIDPSSIAVPILGGGQMPETGLLEQVDPAAEAREKTGRVPGLTYIKGKSKATSPVGDLYTSPEVFSELVGDPKGPLATIAMAMDQGQMLGGGTLRTIMTLAHVTRAGQTVGSIQGANRNYISNALFLLANAHNPGILLGGLLQGASHIPGLGALKKMVPEKTRRHLETAYQPVVEQFYNLTANPLTRDKPLNRAIMLKRLEYVRRGVITQSTVVGDLNQMGRHAHALVKAGQGGESRFNNAYNLAVQWYQSHDSAPKIAAYEHELAVLLKAHPYPKSVGAVAVDEQAHYDKLADEAASKVRRTMQNYDDLPRIVKLMSANPILAPYYSFTASMIRNAAQTIQLSVEEIRTDNPVIQKRGYARLGAFVGTLALPAALAAVMRHASNSDSEDEEAIRKLGYPWSRNSTIAIVKNTDREVTYFDMGFLDGYDKMKAPAVAILRRLQNGEPLDEGFLDALGETADLLGVNMDLFAQAVIEGTTGQRYESNVPFFSPRGRIWEEKDPFAGKIKRALKHVGYRMSPGAFKSGVRFERSMGGEASDKLAGREYNTADEILAVFGPRLVTFDKFERLSSDAKTFKRERASSSTRYHRDKREKGKGDTAAHESTLDDMLTRVKAYKQLGLSSTQIKRVLKENGVGVELSSAVAHENRRTALRLMMKKLED